MTKTKKFFRAFVKLEDGTAFEGVGWTAAQAETNAFAVVKKKLKSKAPKKGDLKFETIESIGPTPRTIDG